MEIIYIITRQTLVMFLYMLAGFCLFKAGRITSSGSKDMATLLLWLVIPAVLINSFCVDFSAEKLKTLFLSSLLGLLALGTAILIGHALFRTSPIDNFAAAFSNAAFIGIPLVQASIGQEAVFYVVGIIAALNILQWTYGVRILTGKKQAAGIRNILLNPIMVGTIIRLLLFVSGLGTRLPPVISTALRGVSSLNAPMAMLILGGYLAQTNIRSMLLTARLYWLSAVRLLLIPITTLLLFRLLPLSYEMKMSVFIAAATPVGANVAVYAQINDLDYPYACQTVALSTVCSILTVPLVLLCAGTLL